MIEEDKLSLLQTALQHVENIRIDIQQYLSSLLSLQAKGQESLKHSSGSDRLVQQALVKYNEKRVVELNELYPSPYFVRCDLENTDSQVESFYFAKFSYPEQGIYSWVTPAARMRFEQPGEVSYMRPDGTEKVGEMVRKDQYLITDGSIVFFVTEQTGAPRELVYQEYFSNRKTGFVLPEIVEQMEKAQDTVIRAHYQGPFVITGPAGSGKTTLALHRIAYLLQSPETAQLFFPQSVLILVQDAGTKKYFAHLLPELGIEGVQITTFVEWAFEILGIDNLKYETRYGDTVVERDKYEYAKLRALRKNSNLLVRKNKNLFELLEYYYEGFFCDSEKILFENQKKEKVLDKMDISVLLMLFNAQEGKLTIENDYFVELKDGTLKKKKGRLPLEYGLIVLDEFQNYLPEQIRLLKTTLRQENSSIMYIGDMAQQVQIGTIRDWSEVREMIPEDRMVKLHKVYRNTKQILQFIESLGYKTTIPKEAREGSLVQEFIYSSLVDQVEHIKSYLENKKDLGTVGILAINESILSKFIPLQKQFNQVHVLTMVEAQGVEFDAVFLVGIDREMFDLSHLENEAEHKEKEKIYKDLLYVALTRAMNELCVLGRVPLKEVMLW